MEIKVKVPKRFAGYVDWFFLVLRIYTLEIVFV